MRGEVFQPIKRVALPFLRPLAPSIRDTVRQSERIAAIMNGLRVSWFAKWNGALDEILDALPSPPGCTRDQYRELLQPTGVEKRHALVTRRGDPLAVISLRRRAEHWEPVSLQVMPGYIAPATDPEALGAALRALGVEVQAQYGFGPEIRDLSPRGCWSYECVVVDLQSDYKSHWLLNNRKHHKHVRSAEKKCARMHVRYDDPSDLEWIVNQWRTQWIDDPGQEVCAAEDRIRFWTALGSPSRESGQLGAQTVQLMDGEKRVAGIVDTYLGDNVQGQCMGWITEYRKRGAGTRALLASLERSSERGFATLNMGGGDYKTLWGPVGAERWGAVFRPVSQELYTRLA